jgi:hypothetical protein
MAPPWICQVERMKNEGRQHPDMSHVPGRRVSVAAGGEVIRLFVPHVRAYVYSVIGSSYRKNLGHQVAVPPAARSTWPGRLATCSSGTGSPRTARVGINPMATLEKTSTEY